MKELARDLSLAREDYRRMILRGGGQKRGTAPRGDVFGQGCRERRVVAVKVLFLLFEWSTKGIEHLGFKPWGDFERGNKEGISKTRVALGGMRSEGGRMEAHTGPKLFCRREKGGGGFAGKA